MSRSRSSDPNADPASDPASARASTPVRVHSGRAADDVGSVLRRGAKAALARWVLHKRKQRAGRRAEVEAWPTPQDEATHEWDGRRHFAEDYTFAGVQPGLAVIARLEWLPGRGAHRVWMTLLRHDGAAASGGAQVFCLPGGQIVRRDSDGDRWRAAGMVVDCRTPLSRWTLAYRGRLQAHPAGPVDAGDETRPGVDDRRCAVDLTFDALGGAFAPGRDDDPDLLAERLGEATWDAKLLAAVRREQNRGYVQLGTLEGSIALGDELIPLRARGWRQHSWGVLDWGAPDDAFQCFLADPGGAMAWVHRVRFPFVTLEGGFVDHRSRRHLVGSIAATFERRPRRAPARASLGVGADVPLDVELELLSDTAFVVDGRGRVELGLVRTASGGVGIWGGQRRARPRRW